MIRPLGERVLIEANAKEETTASGIVLPDTAKEKPQEGKVVAVGSGALKDGVRVALEVRKATALFSPNMQEPKSNTKAKSFDYERKRHPRDLRLSRSTLIHIHGTECLAILTLIIY